MAYLTITELADSCKSRNARWMPDGMDDWTPLELAGAAAGEIGEACNAAKKLKRILRGARNINTVSGNTLPTVEAANAKICKEAADGIIYAMLLILKVGGDPERVIVDVFNAKSEECGFPERLSSDRP